MKGLLRYKSVSFWMIIIFAMSFVVFNYSMQVKLTEKYEYADSVENSYKYTSTVLVVPVALKAVINQQLVPTLDEKQTPVFEIMFTNTAIQNLIREGKTHQIDSAIQAGAAKGMRTMDDDLLRLVKEKRISKETAYAHCVHPENMEKRLAQIPG